MGTIVKSIIITEMIKVIIIDRMKKSRRLPIFAFFKPTIVSIKRHDAKIAAFPDVVIILEGVFIF